MPVQDLLMKARNVLVEASMNGSLDVALQQTLQATNKKKYLGANDWSKSPSVGTWLAKPTPVQVVTKWYEPGKGPLHESRPWQLKASVGTWLAMSPSQQAPKFDMKDMLRLRSQARDVMILASGDGTLENVLREVFKDKAQELQGSQGVPKNLEELRMNVRDAFVKASADGTLREALSADQRDRTKQLRAQARNTFAQASLDGRLGSALADLHRGRQAGVPTIRLGDFRSCPNAAWQQLHAKFPPAERKEPEVTNVAQGFAAAARAAASQNPVAAAGLAAAAAAAAENMQASNMSAKPKVHAGVAAGFAEMAVSAAHAGHATATALVELTALIACNAAKDAEDTRRANLVKRAAAIKGLGDAAVSAAAINPVVAAGLAAAAAAAADEMPPAKTGVDPKVAVGLAKSALDAARAGASAGASAAQFVRSGVEGLVSAAASTAYEAAKARSGQ